MSPVYAAAASIFGRKSTLFACYLVFAIGSALCGAAQNFTWLSVSRAVQGLGGGCVGALNNVC